MLLVREAARNEERCRAAARYLLPQVVSPTPEAQRLVPSEKVEQKKPERQSGSPEQVPHSSVEAQEERAPITRAAQSMRARFGVIGE